ncbi:hypothetical protein GXP67_16130 [Rhodocytophaga rosea]|uniref:Uncharacterized protein n=1 Tax=Rhodocytophaga rosea TaxID=2704465 RepID=A0A6C0GJ51_9BACT|nr:hypothetical protein [Rhodocytophaga rosea]QHT68058.1 hypothetical protein GXP67_16130 [Rhodocytophaga rosea]
MEDRLKKQIGKKYTNRYKSVIAKYSLLPRKNADLKKLFPELYQEGKVEAGWFSGDIKIPKGKLLRYVHMGYMSTYEKELVISIENGLVIETNEYENKPISLPKDYRLITANSYSLFAPGEFISSQESQLFTFSDTITFSNSAQSKKLEAMATFNEKRLEKRQGSRK